MWLLSQSRKFWAVRTHVCGHDPILPPHHPLLLLMTIASFPLGCTQDPSCSTGSAIFSTCKYSSVTGQLPAGVHAGWAVADLRVYTSVIIHALSKLKELTILHPAAPPAADCWLTASLMLRSWRHSKSPRWHSCTSVQLPISWPLPASWHPVHSLRVQAALTSSACRH